MKKLSRLHAPDIAHREALLHRIERLTELPLLVVMQGVVTASRQAGIRPQDTVLGASQGIVQGAAETGADITEVVKHFLNAVRKSAAGIGMSENEAVSRAAEAIGPQVVAEVVEAVPDENLPSRAAESEDNQA